MDYRYLSPCVRYANTISLTEDYPQPLLAYDHRLVYVSQGRMRVEFSGETVCLAAGDLLIFPPAVPYRFTFYPGEDRRYVLVNFDFDSAAWGQHSRHPVEARHFDAAGVFSAEEPLPFRGISHLRNMEECGGMLSELCRAMREEDPYGIAAASGLMKAVLVRCAARLDQAREAVPEGTAALARRIRAYADAADIAAPLTNGEIARELNYHPYYIGRVFTQYYGMSLHVYMIRRRIGEAQRMLAGTELPVGEIAVRCGFSGESYFSETFRRVSGISPTEFRGKNR